MVGKGGKKNPNPKFYIYIKNRSDMNEKKVVATAFVLISLAIGIQLIL